MLDKILLYSYSSAKGKNIVLQGLHADHAVKPFQGHEGNDSLGPEPQILGRPAVEERHGTFCPEYFQGHREETCRRCLSA